MVNYSVNRKCSAAVRRTSSADRFVLYLAAIVALLISRKSLEVVRVFSVILGFAFFLGIIGGIECDVIPFFIGAPVCLGILGSAAYFLHSRR